MRGTNGRNHGNGHITQVSPEQGYRMLDRLTHQYMKMNAQDFIDAWRAGEFRDEDEYPEAVRLSMMIPLAV